MFGSPKWWMVCVVWGLAFGCKRSDTAVSLAASASVRASSVASAKPERDARFVEVEKLVGRWQEAQNSGDFDAYAALYAPGFRGTKRVAERSFEFDRKHWLLDRKPMFVPGLRVSVKQVEIVASGPNVVAFFQQDFSTPAFRDSGRKLLAFAPSSDGFRIAREQMLSSEVQGGGGSVRALPGFFFARADGVVVRSQIDERWLTPERRNLAERFRKALQIPEVPEEPSPLGYETFLKPNEIVLPPEVSAVEGKVLYVTRMPATGSRELPPPCRVKVGKLGVRNTARPAFEGVRAAWGFDHLFGAVVFAPFDAPCPGALWASESEPGKQFLPRPAGKSLLEAARKLSPAFKDFPALQATLVGDDSGKQLLFVRGERELPEGEPQIVNSLFALAGGAPPLHLVASLEPYVMPRLGFDIDADGELEVLTEPQGDNWSVLLLQPRGGKLLATSVYSEPDFVCPG